MTITSRLLEVGESYEQFLKRNRGQEENAFHTQQLPECKELYEQRRQHQLWLDMIERKYWDTFVLLGDTAGMSSEENHQFFVTLENAGWEFYEVQLPSGKTAFVDLNEHVYYLTGESYGL